ncbi:MAG: class I SAM-dependent methyltransferase [Bacteroidota bacterium]|nr:class I SAM-dependent methyltransferase [Bacteroidota bacterium]
MFNSVKVFSHLKSAVSTDNYYKSMNDALARLNDEYTMLHYPLHVNEGESFFDAQKNLTDYCMSLLPPVKGKNILEIGCGNGIQAHYIFEKYSLGSLTAVDLNSSNIDIARVQARENDRENIRFHIDDAQDLSTIESNSMDYIINIESAFHYPDKPAFFREIARVLKPGGIYLIADIMTTLRKRNILGKYWMRRMQLNHWSKGSYEEELPKAGLHIHSFSDITREVIQSFSTYRNWLKTMKKDHFISDNLLKLYYTINVRLNIRLLRRRRQYCIIVGSKQGL